MTLYMKDEDRKPFPTWIDERAAETPERVFALIPRTNIVKDGSQEFTYRQLARAVDKLSWFLDQELGSPAVDFETIAYMGVSDLRYTILYIAVQKTRRQDVQVLFPSDQNSRQAHLNLLSVTNCRVLIASKELVVLWESLRPEVDGLKILAMPDFETFLMDEKVEKYPFKLTWEESKNDPVFIVSTSGSTGLPKPVHFTSYMMSIYNRGDFWPKLRNLRVLVAMKSFWSLGLNFQIQMPLDVGMIPILLPPNAPWPLTASYIDEIHTITKPQAGTYLPMVLKELARNPTYIDNMRHMEMIVFGGAPLDSEVGDLLWTFTSLQVAMGSTEAGCYGQFLATKDDWQYYNFDPRSGLSMIPFSEHDGLFESVFFRHKDESNAKGQLIFNVFPELDRHPTKDVWKEHATKKGFWLYSGRTDDFVRLQTGTTFNASHIEGLIAKDRKVKGVVMGGAGREVPFLLVELDVGIDEEKAREGLWHLVEEVNSSIMSEVRLREEMIMFTAKGKPMKRVLGKGTVNRRATLEEYEGEIDELYQRTAEQTKEVV